MKPWSVGQPPPDEPVSLRTITLEKLQFGSRFTVSKTLLMDATVSIEEVTQYMIQMQVRGFLWSKKNRIHTFTAPADWWQAVRERWCPAWWLARHPVRYRVETIDVRDVFPDLKIAAPGSKGLTLLQLREEYPWAEAPSP